MGCICIPSTVAGLAGLMLPWAWMSSNYCRTVQATLCPGCSDNGWPPSIMLSTAQKLVEQHRQHLAGPPSPRMKLGGDPSR
jgi:hypothetical protein